VNSSMERGGVERPLREAGPAPIGQERAPKNAAAGACRRLTSLSPGGLLAVALAIGLPPVLALGEPTAGCHCFRDRTYEPDRPAAADPYVLATARSSLLSAAFGVPKADLIRAVMGGAAPEDLWVAHAAAAWSGGTASELLEAREAKGSWPAALSGAKGLPPPWPRR
jgi:hypothetical protein